MVNISQYLYKATGIMPKKEILRTCSRMGEDLSEIVHKTGKIEIQDVIDVYLKRLGNRGIKKLVITSDKDSFIEFATKDAGLSREVAEMFYEGSLSAVLPSIKNGTLLSLRVGSMNSLKAVNTTAHETEHVLYKKFSPRLIMEKLYVKLRGKKWMEKYIQKWADRDNKTALYSQANLFSLLPSEALDMYGSVNVGFAKGITKDFNGLLKYLNINSKADFEKIIKKILDLPEVAGSTDLKTKMHSLRALRVILKDEARAYRMGGNAEKNLQKKNGVSLNAPTHSDMIASLYDETIKIASKELKKSRIDFLKTKLLQWKSKINFFNTAENK